MKKLFAKLALFTVINLIIALPLNAFAADDCISKTDREKFIITIMEEPLGKPNNDKNAPLQVRECCRATTTMKINNSETSLTELQAGKCQEGCEIVGSCEQVMVLLSTGGTKMIEGYISMIYKWAASIVGLIAVAVMIISGVQIAASGGDSTAVESAKNRIIKSLSGLAVLFLSGLILYTINPNFFVAK